MEKDNPIKRFKDATKSINPEYFVGVDYAQDTPEDILEEWDEKYDIWKDGYECGYGNCVKWGEQLIKNAKKEGYEEGYKRAVKREGLFQEARENDRQIVAKEIVEMIEELLIKAEKGELFDGAKIEVDIGAYEAIKVVLAQIKKQYKLDGDKQ